MAFSMKMLVISTISACRFLTVDAYKEALPFFLKFDIKIGIS